MVLNIYLNGSKYIVKYIVKNIVKNIVKKYS